MNKVQLLRELAESREAFMAAIEGLDEEAMLQPGAAGDWSVKDVMAHLMMWEAQLVTYLFRTQAGNKPNTVHFGGEPVEQINARWHAQNVDRPLEAVLEDFEGVRAQTIRRVEAFSEKQLNDPQAFPWLGGKPLWEWVLEDSAGHDREHAAGIGAWRGQAPG
jgi:hypothetical protein